MLLKANAEKMIKGSGEKVSTVSPDIGMNSQIYLLTSPEPEGKRRNILKPRYNGINSAYFSLVYSFKFSPFLRERP